MKKLGLRIIVTRKGSMNKIREKLIRLLGGVPKPIMVPSPHTQAPVISCSSMRIQKIGVVGKLFDHNAGEALKTELCKDLMKSILNSNAVEFIQRKENYFDVVEAVLFVGVPDENR